MANSRSGRVDSDTAADTVRQGETIYRAYRLYSKDICCWWGEGTVSGDGSDDWP